MLAPNVLFLMLIFLVGFRICYFIHFDNIRVEADGDQCCNEYANIAKYLGNILSENTLK